MSEATAGQLKLMLENLDDKLMEGFLRNDEQHRDLVTHVTTTNGRVRKLEQWKFMIIGGLVFVNIIAVPVFLMVVSNYLNA